MALTKQKVISAITDVMRSFMCEHGFSPRPHAWFLRVVGECEHMVRFDVLKRPDLYLATLGVGVRFPKIAELLAYPGEPPSPNGTYGGAIHLIACTDYIEWKITDIESIAFAGDESRLLLAQYGFPFLDEFSSLARLKRELEAGDPKYRLLPVDEQQQRNLAAIEVLEGNLPGAIARLDRHIEANKHKLPKHWWDANAMRDKLAAMRG